MRNPPWVRDEIILAMDLYVRAGRRQLPPNRDEVVQLSKLLNSLPIHPASSRGRDFRNPNGISMILGNFLGIDPVHDQAGLPRNNQMQTSVWNEFIDSPGLLHRTADAIQAAVHVVGSVSAPDRLDEDNVFLEGHILTRQHVLRERNRAAVVAKIDQVQRSRGRIACEPCEFDFLEYYGEIGRGFAECHHIVPLAEAAFIRRTRLEDLAIVCANCHRMLHRARPALTVEALKSHIVRPHVPQIGGTA